VEGVLGIRGGIRKPWRPVADLQGRPCLPVFHPSYLLARQSVTAAGIAEVAHWQDLQEVPRRGYDRLCRCATTPHASAPLICGSVEPLPAPAVNDRPLAPTTA